MRPRTEESRRRKSLRLRLVAVLCVSMCALWGSVAAWMHISMRKELLGVLDDRLILSSRMVSGIVSQLSPQMGAGTQVPAERDWLSVIARDGIACEVSLVRGEVEALPIARTANSPAFGDVHEPGFGQVVKGGKSWRTYVLEENGIRITTADRIDIRDHLVQSFGYALVLPFLFVLAGILVVTWWSTKVGLAPLDRLQQALARRPSGDASPVLAGRDVVELAPLVDSLNALLARMSAAIEHERRWTGDAAHELRTPLTAIKTHVQVAQLQVDRFRRAHPDSAAARQAEESLQQAVQGIAHMHGVLEQLLTLARVESGEAGSAAHTEGGDILAAFELACSQSRRQAASQGRDGRIDVCLQPDDASAWATVRVPLAAPLLVCAVGNLLDNALHHHRGEQPVQAALSLERQGGTMHVAISVRDRGPGMSDEDRASAHERFWRKHASGEGSGLGLTIVRRIAGSAGGRLELLPAPDGEGGLLARVMLPVARSPDLVNL